MRETQWDTGANRTKQGKSGGNLFDIFEITCDMWNHFGIIWGSILRAILLSFWDRLAIVGSCLGQFVLEPPWGHLGALRRPSGTILGRSWAPTVHLGPSWAHQGPCLGRLGAFLEESSALLGPLRALLGPLEARLALSGRIKNIMEKH